jgi:hypothetical protein
MLSNLRLGWIAAIVPMLLCVVLAGCHLTKKEALTVEFTEVPIAGVGGAGRLAAISGRVTGSSPGDQIILYARSQRWWVQPLADEPFTPIQADGRWSTKTHLGTEYAVLLVHHGYHPTPVADTLPPQGGDVLFVASTKGKTSPRETALLSGADKVVHFSGYDWEVRHIEGDRNGYPNTYSPDNASVDANGFLHLRVTGTPGDWFCSEVIQTRGFGFGTYRFTLHDVSHMQPALSLSLFTWDDTVIDPPHRELTIEFSRWGDPASKNGQFVVQPYYIPVNVSRFEAPSGPVTASLHWESGKASFEASGSSHSNHPFTSHVFASGVPGPGGERVRMHLCGFNYSKVPLKHDDEVVVEKFEYLP